MAATDEQITLMVEMCNWAGCTDRQIRALVLQAGGMKQDEIAALLEIEQQSVSELLARATARVRYWESSGQAAKDGVSRADVYRLMGGWVYGAESDDPDCIAGHPLTIWAHLQRTSPPPRPRKPRRARAADATAGGIDTGADPVVL